MFDGLKSWFSSLTTSAKEQAIDLETELEKQFGERPETQDLSPELHQKLRHAIQTLSVHPAHQQAVQTALSAAIARWQEDPGAVNGLGVCSSPVESVAEGLPAALDAVLAEEQYPSLQMVVVPQIARPAAPEALLSSLQAALEAEVESSRDKAFPTVIVIPDLTPYFLRSIEGLDGIEYLRDRIAADRSQFWLIGCNRWAWRYLDQVCHLAACVEPPLVLPQLNGLEVKIGLAAIADRLEVEWVDAESRLVEEVADSAEPWQASEQWTSPLEKRYFDHLASIATGLNTTAAWLWLRSLQSSKASPKQVIRRRAVLPKLPALEPDDRYLLFSLLLHQRIQLQQLALSLGDPESQVQARVQRLKREGVIQLRQDELQLNPAYYPAIRSDLERNNFELAGS